MNQSFPPGLQPLVAATSLPQNGQPMQLIQAIAPPQMHPGQTLYSGPQQLLPGIQIIGDQGKAPHIIVTAREKDGKSTTAITTLVGWPRPGFDPLVLAWDKTGPDACLRLGYKPHVLKIGDQVGASYLLKMRSTLQMLETNIQQVRARYGAIVVDCYSTMIEMLLEDGRKFSRNPDPRSHYFDAEKGLREFINRLLDLELPIVGLCWLSEPETHTESIGPGKTKSTFVPGGILVAGQKIRKYLAGKVQHIFVLERQKVGVGAQGADDLGFKRVLHSQAWENINSGGRLSHLLPEPCPAHVGWILTQVTGKGT